jgi:hypothetical protein
MPEPGEVKAARNRAGLTQQQLADILGVHVKTLRDYEKGKRARLRAGGAKLADFLAAHPEPQKSEPPAPTVALRPLAEASDMELIAVLTARLALLRAAVDGPIPASVEASAPTVVVQTVLSPSGGPPATGTAAPAAGTADAAAPQAASATDAAHPDPITASPADPSRTQPGAAEQSDSAPGESAGGNGSAAYPPATEGPVPTPANGA